MAPPTCPICNRPVELRSKNPAFPFCSTRCRTVDLGKWLNEEYRISSAIAAAEDGETDEAIADDGSRVPN